VAQWEMDDKMKYSAETGDDAWDATSYLNIWVCNLRRIAGYSSVPGSDLAKDGIVVDYTVFGSNATAGYDMGKTAVHEVGHWLGLKHTWGDDYCGDDLVDDTPKQASFTTGCPSGLRISCNNAPTGDMYMNYMDYSSDACVNIFTRGQKARMRSLFEAGGPRAPILVSKGLDAPLIVEAPLPIELPRWLEARVYPNPAYDQLTLDIAFDPRWLGKTLTISDASGRTVKQIIIRSKTEIISISHLRAGVYFLSASKEDGSYIIQKFIKI
jgi:hypothetical protein